jgi:putative aldouronate transport system substrate-binding protein
VVILAVILLSLVPAGMVSATGSTEGGAGAVSRMVITWMGHNDKVFAEGNPAEKLIEERFNVDIRQATVPASEEEKVILYFTEGKEADLINVWSNDTFRKLADQGVLRSVPEQWLYTSMPKWMAKVEELVGKETVKSQLTYNGKVWGAPYIDYANVMPYIMVWRKDWMDKVGVTKTPTTLDEVLDLLKKYTFSDPDGNGKADTYGTHDVVHPSRKFPYVLGAYGIQYNSYYLRGGKVVYANVLPEYKQALKTLNAWYKAGVIDPEFITDDRNIQRKKWTEGKFGFLHDHPWWMAQSTQGNVLQMVKDANPKADFVVAPPPKGPEGKAGATLYYPSLYNQGAVLFGRNTDDAKVKKIMEIKEAFAKDHTFWLRVYHGDVGVHYDVGSDGMIAKRALTPEALAGAGLGSCYALQPETLADADKLLSAGDKSIYTAAMKMPVIFYSVTFPVAKTNESAKTKGTDVTTLAAEFYYQAITGKVDIDKEWDGYVNKLLASGLSDILAEYQRLF